LWYDTNDSAVFTLKMEAAWSSETLVSYVLVPLFPFLMQADSLKFILIRYTVIQRIEYLRKNVNNRYDICTVWLVYVPFFHRNRKTRHKYQQVLETN